MASQVDMVKKCMSLGALTQVQDCRTDHLPLSMIQNGWADQMFPGQDMQDTQWTLLWMTTMKSDHSLEVIEYRNPEWIQR